jgi:endonuclease YncB( thermonuclease family)
MVKTPKYALNVDYVEDNGSGYNVFFNNTDISDKYVAVCWYGENGDLVDFDIKAATEVYSGEYIALYRSNATEATNAKVNVFRFDTDSESANYGEFDVIEIYNIN